MCTPHTDQSHPEVETSTDQGGGRKSLHSDERASPQECRGGQGADCLKPMGALAQAYFQGLPCPWQRSHLALRRTQRKDRRSREERSGAGVWGADGQGRALRARACSFTNVTRTGVSYWREKSGQPHITESVTGSDLLSRVGRVSSQLWKNSPSLEITSP